MLNEISSHRRTNAARSHLYEESEIVKLIEAKSRMVVSRDCGKGNGELLFDEYKVSVMLDEYALQICCTAQ